MDTKKRKELIARVITGVILGVIALALIIKANEHIFFAVILAVNLLGTHEFIKMVTKEDKFVIPNLMWISSVIVPVSIFYGGFTVFTCILFLLMFVIFLLKMFSQNPTENVVEDVSYGLFTCVFIPFLFTFLALVKTYGYEWLLFLCFIIWASDSFAYFTGMAIGKHKLIPKVSPGKSIEGLIGGLIGALIIAGIMNYYLLHSNWTILLIVAVEVIVAGVIGDLIESMIKRSAGVKDSGSIIPGHGGILDRFDSLLIGAPVLYFYLTFLVNR